MKKTVIAIVSACLYILAACNSSQSGKPDRKLLIPENKLVEILTDTYLTSGMLDVGEIRDTWGQRDSILNYIDVIKSHGYTYQQFDTTLKYYFIVKPKRLARIYDKVNGNLVELEVRVMNEKAPGDTLTDDNLWTGRKTYTLPEDFPRDPVWFDIPVDAAGTYVLKADILLFPDDRSIDPRVTVYFSTVDSMGVERRDYWQEIRLQKDGESRTIEIMKKLDSARGVHIRGWILNHTNQQGNWKKHARIRNISLRLEQEVPLVK
jgi:hypothetical protein